MHTDENDFKYFSSLDEMKAEGFTPIKVVNLCQFFIMQGRATKIIKDNLIPIHDLTYTVLAKHPGGDRYYLRTYKNYSVEELYFYRKEDMFMENLRRYCDDGRVHILMTAKQVAEMTETLQRLYKSFFKEEGQVPYKIWVRLCEASLDMEDYADIGKNLTGYKTVINQYSIKIAELWKQCKNNPK